MGHIVSTPCYTIFNTLVIADMCLKRMWQWSKHVSKKIVDPTVNSGLMSLLLKIKLVKFIKNPSTKRRNWTRDHMKNTGEKGNVHIFGGNKEGGSVRLYPISSTTWIIRCYTTIWFPATAMSFWVLRYLRYVLKATGIKKDHVNKLYLLQAFDLQVLQPDVEFPSKITGPSIIPSALFPRK